MVCAATANRRQGLVRMIECAARSAFGSPASRCGGRGLGAATIATTKQYPGTDFAESSKPGVIRPDLPAWFGQK